MLCHRVTIWGRKWLQIRKLCLEKKKEEFIWTLQLSMLGGCTSVTTTKVCKLSGIIPTHRWKMFTQQMTKRLDPHFWSLWRNWVMKIYPLYPAVLLKGQFIVCQSRGIKTTSQSTSFVKPFYIYTMCNPACRNASVELSHFEPHIYSSPILKSNTAGQSTVKDRFHLSKRCCYNSCLPG